MTLKKKSWSLQIKLKYPPIFPNDQNFTSDPPENTCINPTSWIFAYPFLNPPAESPKFLIAVLQQRRTENTRHGKQLLAAKSSFLGCFLNCFPWNGEILLGLSIKIINLERTFTPWVSGGFTRKEWDNVKWVSLTNTWNIRCVQSLHPKDP